MTMSRKPPPATPQARTQPIIKPKAATLLGNTTVTQADVPAAPSQKATRQPRIKPK